MEIDIKDYLSEEEIKEIAREELTESFREQFRTEADVERVLANLSHEYIFNLINSVWNGDFEQLLKEKVKKAICDESLKYYIFRRKDAWERTESPAVAIMDEECRNSRPLIKSEIEKRIKEYPFYELKEVNIPETIAEVISDKLFGKKETEDDI